MAGEGFIFIAVIICSFIFRVSSLEVPVLIWGDESFDGHPPASALNSVGQDEFETKYLKKILSSETLLVAFIQDKLSLEDFYQYDNNRLNEDGIFTTLKGQLDSHPSVVLPAVTSPVQSLEKATTQYQVKKLIVGDGNFNRSSLEDVDVLIVKLPSTQVENRGEALKHIDQSINSILHQVVGVKKKLVAIYTAPQPSWDAQDSKEVYIRHGRSLLGAKVDDIPGFMNYSGCMLMYYKNLTVTVDVKDGTNASSIIQSLGLPSSPNNNSFCGNTSARLIIDFKPEDSLSKFVLELNFSKPHGSWWLEEAVITVSSDKINQNETAVTLRTESIGGASGFSYSCGSLLLQNANLSDEVIVQIKFNVFQVQVFDVQGVFSDSFDCTTFFTIPTWMGILVVLIFSIILACGIQLLFGIHTMDRFDDPKGKPIMVPTTE
ncbi:V-type proton ATPase subunit S1-like [Tachypleus tridentatus]|uniref:V-type proton ATPase subunit S1-like n=1 Tax=Tachypleus tridentatus TaxID=6853 RepID=UPI003FD05BB4